MSRFLLLCAVILLLAAGACTPWTVRPIEAENAPAAQNPARYVDSIWNSKLLPAVLNGAVDARTLLDALVKSPADALTRYGHREANGPPYLLVKGEGVVTKVDTQSRVGLALIDVAPYDGKPDLSIQIGPVLRGTSLRDATGVIRFTDFVNQLQFADVANELNDRVLKTVLSGIDPETLKGKKVSFTGTAAVDPTHESYFPCKELTPVRLTVEEAR
jgi:predicted lipoprotein